jgi:hypothetical protein
MRNWLRKFLIWLLDKTQAGNSEPFGCYFTSGIQNGQAPIQFVWNKAFVENLRAFGYDCETEEETVELFYIATRPTPQQYDDPEEVVNSEDHPLLSNDTHSLRR